MDVHTALGPFGHDSLLVLYVSPEEGATAEDGPGHVVDMGSACAALGGDGTPEGLEKFWECTRECLAQTRRGHAEARRQTRRPA